MQVVDHPSRVVRRTQKHISWKVNHSLPSLARDDVTRRLVANRNAKEDMICEVTALSTKEADLERPEILWATWAGWKLLRQRRCSR